MGFFTNSTKEEESIIGMRMEDMRRLDDTKLLMVAIARTMEGVGMQSKDLIDELYRRAGAGPRK